MVVAAADDRASDPLHGLAERLRGDPAVDRRRSWRVADRRGRARRGRSRRRAGPSRWSSGRSARRNSSRSRSARADASARQRSNRSMASSVVSSRAWRRKATRIGYRRSAGHPLQGLVGRPLAELGQELEPVGVQAPEVPAVDPPADQGGPPLQGGEDRGGRGGDLPLPEPGQEGPVRRLVGDEQAVQERAPRSRPARRRAASSSRARHRGVRRRPSAPGR